MSSRKKVFSCLLAALVIGGSLIAFDKFGMLKKQVDELAGWKTYANQICGFSFRYPNDWEVISESGTSASVRRMDNSQLSFECWSDLNILKNLQTIGQNAESLKEYLTITGDSPSNIQEKDIANAEVAYESIYPSMSGASYELWMENHGKIYLIYSSDVDDKGRLPSIEQQILTSFTLTNE